MFDTWLQYWTNTSEDCMWSYSGIKYNRPYAFFPTTERTIHIWTFWIRDKQKPLQILHVSVYVTHTKSILPVCILLFFNVYFLFLLYIYLGVVNLFYFLLFITKTNKKILFVVVLSRNERSKSKRKKKCKRIFSSSVQFDRFTLNLWWSLLFFLNIFNFNSIFWVTDWLIYAIKNCLVDF